ncbi:uncharacterized protein LOC128197343 [Vigna angularis]|uniref:uncharacterized protein LOC128197343 n=1 Tax=Phaseolus angularis TaxID=3914 RepID=UPI0022B5B42D|nr:uncharacterized protein LOC128197343 [Vigna angularis]
MVKDVFGCKCETAEIKGVGEGEFSCLCRKNHVAARLDFLPGLAMVFDFSLHHMGKFVKNTGIEYVGGEIHVIKGIDPDRWSYFEAVGYVKEFKYDAEFKLWWKGAKQKAMNNLRLLSDDKEALFLANYAEANNDEVEIYVQHVQPSQPDEVKFLCFGEEAVQETEEEVNMEEEVEHIHAYVDEEDAIVDEEVGYVGEAHAYVAEDDDAVDKEDGYVGEAHAYVAEEDDVVDKEDGYVHEAHAYVAKEDDVVDKEDGYVHEAHAYVAEEDDAVDKEDGYVGGVEGNVEVEDVLMDYEEEEGNVEDEYVQRGEEETYVDEEEEEGNVAEEEVVENVDDSEEERMENDDDGFGMEDERVEEERRNINPVLERWSTMKKRKKSVRRRNGGGEGSFMINEDVGQHEHEINEDYNTDELSSNVDSDEAISENRRKFPKYRADDMSKSFKFTLGMEFKSLKDFKSALQEHSVLNGKEVKFVKNDLKRVRAVCKKGCGFVIMASKVGGRETFRVKTLVGRHKCGRVFGNKSASVQWIAQVLVDRFVNVGGMTVNQIIDEIKKSFSVGISPWKAGRAKQIAMDSLVGDGERQYGRLYDYVAELVRVKAGTFKIKVNQPQPTLPPRFGAFYMCLEGCKEGFLGSCRSFIGVDGCHLKITYGGQLLVAVARDPNDQYFPLSFCCG